MTQLSGYCTNCGSEIEGGASFCTKCGAPTSQTLQNDVEEKSSEGGRDYRRYLAVDKTGGFLGIAAPIFVWSTAAGVLMWSVIGLISLRFDIGYVDLSDLLFSMLIILAIMLSVAANSYIVHSYRGRDGQTWQTLSYLPMAWAAFLSVGLLILITQVWTDFAGGSNELRRAMFSLIGVGLCGTYSGYLSLVVIGSNRVYHWVRRVMYVFAAVIALEVLDALWLTERNLPGREFLEHLLTIGGTAITCIIVYSIMVVIIAQARTDKGQLIGLLAYLVAGIIGFTIAVWSLWEGLSSGPIRFVHGGIVIVCITTIGLLVVQHFQRHEDTRNKTAGDRISAGQPEANPAISEPSDALSNAQRMLAQGEATGGDPRLAAADFVLSYLSDRFEIPFVGVTRETIVQRLVGAGVPTELAQRVEDILATGEAARYTPEPPSSIFSRDHFERTANLLVELDGAIQT